MHYPQPLVASLRAQYDEKISKRGKADKFGVHELAEIWRLLASLEHLPSSIKEELGTIAQRKLIHRSDSLADAGVWALGRFGTRVPVYGPLNELVSPEIASNWALKIIDTCQPNLTLHLTLMLLCRRSNDRYRDLESQVIEKVLQFMKSTHAPNHFIDLIENFGGLDKEEQDKVFGEQLPSGLRIIE